MRWREHQLFLLLLAGGLVLRAMVVYAFPPGFVFSDGPVYLSLVDELRPLEERLVGYGVVLHVLAWLDRSVWLVVLVQHLLGLLTAVAAYVLLTRRSVSRRLAALATIPVLFDGMQLTLEHSVLSDVLFNLVVLLGILCLAWPPRPSLPWTALGALLLGAAVTVRVVGQPLVIAVVVFLLLACVTWRTRLLHGAVATIAFVVPVLGYSAWYHAEYDEWGLSDSGGRALYMRTTAWVDCAQLSVPAYQETLCPPEPLGSRLEPTEYGWHSPDPSAGLSPPAGVTPNQAMGEFARTAIRAQPWDYSRTVLRDIALNFAVPRLDYFEYDTASKWSFGRYTTLQATDYTRPAYLAHGGDLPTDRTPLSYLLAGYGYVVYLWGPALLALLALAVAGLARGRGPNRPLILLLLLVGIGLSVAPAVTAEFVWRYQLPAIVLVPLAAALSWTRLRRGAS